MKNRLYKFAFLTFALLISGPALIAQKSISDIAELSDKKWDKLVKSYKNTSTAIGELQKLLNAELLAEENLPNPKKSGY